MGVGRFGTTKKAEGTLEVRTGDSDFHHLTAA